MTITISSTFTITIIIIIIIIIITTIIITILYYTIRRPESRACPTARPIAASIQAQTAWSACIADFYFNVELTNASLQHIISSLDLKVFVVCRQGAAALASRAAGSASSYIKLFLITLT